MDYKNDESKLFKAFEDFRQRYTNSSVPDDVDILEKYYEETESLNSEANHFKGKYPSYDWLSKGHPKWEPIFQLQKSIGVKLNSLYRRDMKENKEKASKRVYYSTLFAAVSAVAATVSSVVTYLHYANL